MYQQPWTQHLIHFYVNLLPHLSSFWPPWYLAAQVASLALACAPQGPALLSRHLGLSFYLMPLHTINQPPSTSWDLSHKSQTHLFTSTLLFSYLPENPRPLCQTQTTTTTTTWPPVAQITVIFILLKIATPKQLIQEKQKGYLQNIPRIHHFSRPLPPSSKLWSPCPVPQLSQHPTMIFSYHNNWHEFQEPKAQRCVTSVSQDIHWPFSVALARATRFCICIVQHGSHWPLNWKD